MNGQTKAKFGFGLMRLPKVDDKIDLPQVCEMVDRFLAAHPEYAPEPFVLPGPAGEVPEGRLTLWPHIHDTDGFFIAKLRRRL